MSDRLTVGIQSGTTTIPANTTIQPNSYYTVIEVPQNIRLVSAKLNSYNTPNADGLIFTITTWYSHSHLIINNIGTNAFTSTTDLTISYLYITV